MLREEEFGNNFAAVPTRNTRYSPNDKACQTDLSGEDLDELIATKNKLNEELKNENKFKRNDTSVNFYTGIPSVACFCSHGLARWDTGMEIKLSALRTIKGIKTLKSQGENSKWLTLKSFFNFSKIATWATEDTSLPHIWCEWITDFKGFYYMGYFSMSRAQELKYLAHQRANPDQAAPRIQTLPKHSSSDWLYWGFYWKTYPVISTKINLEWIQRT